MLSEVSGSVCSPFTTAPYDLRSPQGFTWRDSRHALTRLPGSPARDYPQTCCRGWSPPVRFRYTRNSGRAQQRNFEAATGSLLVSLKTHPEPNHRSVFSKRLSQGVVKRHRQQSNFLPACPGDGTGAKSTCVPRHASPHCQTLGSSSERPASDPPGYAL